MSIDRNLPDLDKKVLGLEGREHLTKGQEIELKTPLLDRAQTEEFIGNPNWELMGVVSLPNIDEAGESCDELGFFVLRLPKEGFGSGGIDNAHESRAQWAQVIHQPGTVALLTVDQFVKAREENFTGKSEVVAPPVYYMKEGSHVDIGRSSAEIFGEGAHTNPAVSRRHFEVSNLGTVKVRDYSTNGTTVARRS